MGRGRLARTSAARAKATAGRVLILRADGCVSSTGPHARAQLDGNRRMHVGRHTRAHLQRSALSTRFKLPRVLIVARTGPGDPRGAKRGADRRSTLSFPFPFRFDGVLVVYEIYINGVLKYSHNTTVRSFTIENLLPYTKYDIAVQACTNKCSDPAKTNIQTAIGAPGRFEKQPTLVNQGSTNIFNNSYSSGIIGWGEPTYKGGKLDFYELKTTFRGTDDTVQESIVQLKSQECFMEKLCVNNVTGVYQFSVRAVNFVFTPHAPVNKTFEIVGSTGKVNCENDEILRRSIEGARHFDSYGYLLFGEWSESYGHSCHYSNINTKLTAFILVSLIASLVFVVMVFYLYRKIKDMKDILIQMPPGLEDLTSDKLKKAKDINSDKNGKPDLLHNVDSQFITNEDEHGRLLRGSLNGSINGNDCSSSIRSESTRSDGEPADALDDIEYDSFGQLPVKNTNVNNHSYGNDKIQVIR